MKSRKTQRMTCGKAAVLARVPRVCTRSSGRVHRSMPCSRADLCFMTPASANALAEFCPPRAVCFNKTIIAGIRVIDLSFGVDHINDLWLTEDEKWDEERLWGRPEDDSETNTDSEAEDALEFMLGSRKRTPAPGFP